MSIEAAGPRPLAAFLDLGIACMSFEETVGEVQRRSRAESFSFVVTPNVDHVVRMSRERSDGLFRSAYRAAALTICDSRILALLARLCGERLSVIPGSDLTARLFGDGIAGGDRVVVAGGSEAMVQALAARRPRVDLLHIAAPMNLAHDSAARLQVAEAIEQAHGHYVFLVVGAPQSEIIAAEIAARGLTGGVGLCVGASLEFLTGEKRRAPCWSQRANLEWLYRLLSEPRRLWRRYLCEGPAIVAVVLRWRLNRRPV